MKVFLEATEAGNDGVVDHIFRAMRLELEKYETLCPIDDRGAPRGPRLRSRTSGVKSGLERTLYFADSVSRSKARKTMVVRRGVGHDVKSWVARSPGANKVAAESIKDIHFASVTVSKESRSCSAFDQDAQHDEDVEEEVKLGLVPNGLPVLLTLGHIHILPCATASTSSSLGRSPRKVG